MQTLCWIFLKKNFCKMYFSAYFAFLKGIFTICVKHVLSSTHTEGYQVHVDVVYRPYSCINTRLLSWNPRTNKATMPPLTKPRQTLGVGKTTIRQTELNVSDPFYLAIYSSHSGNVKTTPILRQRPLRIIPDQSIIVIWPVRFPSLFHFLFYSKRIRFK